MSFSSTLVRLDREEALALIAGARRAGMGVDAVITGILAPALAEVGRRWAAGEVGAAEALAASGIARSCIPHSAIRSTRPDEGRRVIAVCCPPGEEHVIPAEMVTEVLRHAGWPVQHLGAGVTAAHLPAFLARYRPLAVLVSSTTTAGLAGTAELIAVGHRHHVPVMVGGAAFGHDDFLALRLGAAGWAKTAAHAAALLEEWTDRPPALPATCHRTAAYLALQHARPQIRAAAGKATRLGNGADPSGKDERLQLLLDSLEAALLVDDGRVFLDTVSWFAAYDECRRVGAHALREELQAMATALPAYSEVACRFVQDGQRHLVWSRRAGAAAAPAGGATLVPAAGAATFPAGGTVTVPPAPAPAAAAGLATVPPAKASSTSLRPVNTERAGRVFSDLLFVVANGSDTPFALLSIPQGDGEWRTLSHPSAAHGGRLDRQGEEHLFSLAVSHDGPLQIANLAEHPDFTGSALVASGARFAYAVAMRNRQGSALAVLCLLDRRPKVLSVSEQQVVIAIVRQITSQLTLLIRNDPRPAEPHRPRVAETMLRTHDVAEMFDVTDRTVVNWVSTNRLAALRTAGGHLRFRVDDVLALRSAHNARR
ncbi:MAG TPA: cobalamin-dependent protein [Acidimicrobiales bacterium]|nr:cobalamin-dependent protein [Acidimicrobiales bacterium]